MSVTIDRHCSFVKLQFPNENLKLNLEEHTANGNTILIATIFSLKIKVNLYGTFFLTFSIKANSKDDCLKAALLFQEGHENEAEGVLNSIVSMLVLLPNEKAESLIETFCEKLVKSPAPKLGLVCMRVLSVLFQGLEPTSPMRYTVYHALVQVAGQIDQIKSVFVSLDKTRQQLAPCCPDNEQMQNLLRVLHEALLNCKER